LARKNVALVTALDLRKWRDELAKNLAAATVNRTANGLKAALNLLADHDESIPNRRAWENGLASLHDAEESRNVILPEAEIRAMIDKATNSGCCGGGGGDRRAGQSTRSARSAGSAGRPHRSAPDDAELTEGSREEEGCASAGPHPSRAARKLRGTIKDRPLAAPLLVKPALKAENARTKSGRLARLYHGRNPITPDPLREPSKIPV
jgi:hypothetical protein